MNKIKIRQMFGDSKVDWIVNLEMGDIESINVNIGDKIVCVNDKTKKYNGKKLKNITINNVYSVLNIKRNTIMVISIKIMGDKNICWVKPKRFKANEEFTVNHMRHQNLTDILTEDMVEL